MPRDSGGTYTLPAGNPVTTGTAISSTWANNTLNDIVTALTGSLSRSGDGSMLAPLELDSGTLGAPGLCFGAETGLGLYRVSASVLGVAVGGVKVAQFDSTGLVVPLAAAVTGNATVGGTLGVTGVLSALSSLELGHASDTTLARIAAGRVSIEGKEIANLTDSQTFAGRPVFSATSSAAANSWSLNINNANPGLMFYETDAPADEKVWEFRVSAGDFILASWTDAFGGQVTPITIRKSGSALSSWTLIGTLYDFTSGPVQVTSLELGHASDTTLARIAAGRASIEGLEIGYRNLPPVGTKTGSYTLTVGDVGKYVQVGTGGSITIPDATFAEGDAIYIVNNTAGNITITNTITTAYIAGTNADVATFTLATRGVCALFFLSGTVVVASGNIS